MVIKYTKYFDNCLAVFQGGGCKAIAYIGAYKEAKKRGVIFNEVAGASAGSIIAALIAAGATPNFLEEFVVNNLKTIQTIESGSTKTIKSSCKEKFFKWFLRKDIKKYCPAFFQRYLKENSIANIFEEKGFYNTNILYKLIDTALKQLLNTSQSVQFSDLIINLNVVASDLKEKQIVVWNKANCKGVTVADAVCASCSLPLYFQPYKGRYVDGGMLSNLPNFVFSQKPQYTNRLCFLPKPNNEGKQDSFRGFIEAMISTITEGATKMQQTILPGSHLIDIEVGDIDATSFDLITPEKIKELITNGEVAVSRFINNEDNYNPLTQIKSKEISSIEQLYTYISTLSYQMIDEVVISSRTTKWCWKLFPTLLKWVENNAKITVYSSKDAEDMYENARIRLLQKLNCCVSQEEDLPAYVFFLKSGEQWKGIVYSYKENNEFDKGIYYDHIIDGYAIEAAMKDLKNRLKDHNSSYRGIEIIDNSQIIKCLKRVSQYSNAEFEFAKFKVEKVKFMNSQIRLSKYRQINKMFNLYRQAGVDLFENAELVFSDGTKSLICPIVLEERDGEYIIMEGKTRIIYAYNHDIKEVPVVIVHNVQESLPCDPKQPMKTIQQVIMTDNKKVFSEQYKNLYRHIEEAFHPSDTYLL